MQSPICFPNFEKYKELYGLVQVMQSLGDSSHIVDDLMLTVPKVSWARF
jgi:hypothetical protein